MCFVSKICKETYDGIFLCHSVPVEYLLDKNSLFFNFWLERCTQPLPIYQYCLSISLNFPTFDNFLVWNLLTTSILVDKFVLLPTNVVHRSKVSFLLPILVCCWMHWGRWVYVNVKSLLMWSLYIVLHKMGIVPHILLGICKAQYVVVGPIQLSNWSCTFTLQWPSLYWWPR